jgi:hypothetical protein
MPILGTKEVDDESICLGNPNIVFFLVRAQFHQHSAGINWGIIKKLFSKHYSPFFNYCYLLIKSCIVFMMNLLFIFIDNSKKINDKKK